MRRHGNFARLVLVFFIIGSVVAVTVAVSIARKRPDLIHRSVRRADASHWLPYPHYTFSSDQDVVAFAWISRKKPDFIELHLDGGVRQTRLPEPPLITASTCASPGSYISPDGAWILQVAQGLNPTYFVRSLRSTKTVFWVPDGQEAYSFAWLSDSRRFVAIENRKGQYCAVVRDIKDSGRQLVKQIPNETGAWMIEGIGGPKCAVSVSDVVIDTTLPGLRELTVCRFSVLADERPAEAFVVKAPRESDTWYAIPSHDSTKLVLVLHYIVPVFNLAIGVPPWKTSRRIFESLWVSDISGSHMREIGHYERKTPHDAIRDVQWLPGDRGLSYISKDSLWTVSVQ